MPPGCDASASPVWRKSTPVPGVSHVDAEVPVARCASLAEIDSARDCGYPRGSDVTRRGGAGRGAPIVLALMVAILVGSPGVGAAASPVAYGTGMVPVQPPPPTPPPNPGDEELERSRGDVAARSAEVGRL